MQEQKLVVYSDFICPFCYIGKVNAERLQQEIPGLELEWKEFELHPEGQPDAKGPYMKQALENVKYLAKEYGIEMRPEVLTEVTSDSRKALLGFEFAKEHGAEGSYRDAVFHAYWVEGKDIAEDHVLREVAKQVNLDPVKLLEAIENPVYHNKLRASIHEAHANGITGVPTYRYGDMETVGAQPLENLKKMVEIQNDKEQLNNQMGLTCGPEGC
ncbi:DsbA family oxidoreductase [Pseudalkalibacillus sp. JSM 102089]|uniref:DsbA family oxidoreductase n=1 Tax=Pseudalkalibacillus sp. JSM 102089 TaxID=3229856 RepID=UPI0035259929